MLSVVKRLGPTSEILRSAQHDSGWPIRLFSPDEFAQPLPTGDHEGPPVLPSPPSPLRSMRPPASLDGLGCHLEHIRSTRCKLREGFVARGSEMLRFAQHDMVVHLSLTWLQAA